MNRRDLIKSSLLTAGPLAARPGQLWDAGSAKAAREEMMLLAMERMIGAVDSIPERKCLW